MKTQIISFLLLGILSFTACQGGKTKTTTDEEIVNTITINNQGDTLRQVYNNTKGTVTLHYKGEEIKLKQDTMASGVKFSNGQYILTEWQGETTLTKNGEVVFQRSDRMTE